VEVRGVEPLSEREPTRTSPSAVHALVSRLQRAQTHSANASLANFPFNPQGGRLMVSRLNGPYALTTRDER